ncbi:MAG: NAD(P)H-dependent oxidoreductase subunit E, partial [Chloroflexi bacterium]|nr:NAD(P)H-dependent oxidoreductase subunit E [Chloroflexota bacterium]
MAKIQEKSALPDGGHESVLVLLQKAQEKFGYVSDEVIAEIAESLNTSVGEVYGVATFYSFLSSQPLGRNVIRVCKSLPCFLKNSEMIIKGIAEEIGLKPGETTSDGRFSLELTNCIGECDQAPA